MHLIVRNDEINFNNLNVCISGLSKTDVSPIDC